MTRTYPDDDAGDDPVAYHERMQETHDKLGGVARKAERVHGHAMASDAHGLAAALHELGEDNVSSDHAETATRLADHLSGLMDVRDKPPAADAGTVRGTINKSLRDLENPDAVFGKRAQNKKKGERY